MADKKRKADDSSDSSSSNDSKRAKISNGDHSEVPFGVAVIGYGRMGIIHARNVAQAGGRVRLVCVVARNTTRAQQVIEPVLGSSIKIVSTLDEALADPTVNGVVVASATEAHAEHILAAVRSKRHVFCEKPVSLDPSLIEQCFREAAENNVVLLCGYQRRFDPSLSQIRRAISEGAIGQVQLMRLTSRDHPPPPEEYVGAASTGSFFDDFSTHDVDEACWLTGEVPTDDGVYACASALLGSKTVDDTAVLVLKFPSGGLAIIENSRQSQYGYDVRLEVLGSNGSMLQLVNSHQSHVVLHTPDGARRDIYDHSFPERFEQAYKNELDHWFQLSNAKQAGLEIEPVVTSSDCINAARLTTLAQQVRTRQRSSVELQTSKPTAQPYPTLPDDRVCVCLFGGGRMGQVRAAAVQQYPNAKVKYIVDIAASKLQHLASKFNCKVISFEEVDEALNDSEVNTVIIATTSSSHFELISKSIATGKQVFCEKPLALTYSDTQSCVDAAARANLALYCGFQRRSDVNFRRARDLIRASGQVHQIRVTSREPGGHSDLAYLLSSGGFLYDSVIHDIDMCRWIADAEPVEVFCNGTAHNEQLRQVGDIDSVVVVLRFASGIIATIDNHRHANYGYDQRIEVLTSQGMFQVDNEPQTTVVLHTPTGVERHSPKPGMDRYAQTYDHGTRHFLDLITGRDKSPRVIPEDCTGGARIADACKESLKTGKPVSL